MSLYTKKLRARELVLRTQRPHWYLHDGHWHATRPLWVRREEQAPPNKANYVNPARVS